MASDAVKRILEAESEANRKNAEARKRQEEMINNAVGNSALTIQKKLSEANAESDRIRKDYDAKLQEYRSNAEADFENELARLKDISEKNMSKAVEAIISKVF